MAISIGILRSNVEPDSTDVYIDIDWGVDSD